MPVRMKKDAMDRIIRRVEKIKSESTDSQVLTLINVVSKCIDIIDDLQEDIIFYEEELERLKFEREDRRFERSGIKVPKQQRRR